MYIYNIYIYISISISISIYIYIYIYNQILEKYILSYLLSCNVMYYNHQVND